MYNNFFQKLLIFLGVTTIIVGFLFTFLLRTSEVRSYEIGIRRLRTYIFRYDTIEVDSSWIRIDEENLIVETYIKFDVVDVFGNQHEDIVAVTYAGGPQDKVLDLIRPGDDNYEEFLNPIRTDEIVPKWEIDYYYSPPALIGLFLIATGIIVVIYSFLAKTKLINPVSVLDFTIKDDRNIAGELKENKTLFDEGKISRVEYHRRRNELI